MWGLKYSEQRAKGADIEQWPNRWHQRYNQLRWPFPDRWQVTVHINVSRAQWLEKTSVANCCSFELKGTCRGVLVTYKWCFWTHRRECIYRTTRNKASGSQAKLQNVREENPTNAYQVTKPQSVPCLWWERWCAFLRKPHKKTTHLELLPYTKDTCYHIKPGLI